MFLVLEQTHSQFAKVWPRAEPFSAEHSTVPLRTQDSVYLNLVHSTEELSLS